MRERERSYNEVVINVKISDQNDRAQKYENFCGGFVESSVFGLYGMIARSQWSLKSVEVQALNRSVQYREIIIFIF